MRTSRLEAFSDGVLAIIITIMVLDLRPPEGHDLNDLRPLVPKLLAYALSFVNLGVYWNNHHHLFQATERVTGGILWANLHLLFWLSLFPFFTDWIGDDVSATGPAVAYAIVLLAAAVAYIVLQRAIVRSEPEGALGAALERSVKGLASPILYASAIPVAFVDGRLSTALFVAVALIWFVPDRRIERQLADHDVD